MIAAQIAADLREALSILDNLARDLARPIRPPARVRLVETVPLPHQEAGQLAFDLPAPAPTT